MPLLLILAGLVLVVTAIRGTTGALATQLAQDVTGGFIVWLAALGLIGALGFIPGLRTPSRYLIALVALVIMLASGSGFLSKFVTAIETPAQPVAPQPAGGNANLPAIPVSSSSSSSSSGGSGGSGGGMGGISTSDISTYATIAAMA